MIKFTSFKTSKISHCQVAKVHHKQNPNYNISKASLELKKKSNMKIMRRQLSNVKIFKECENRITKKISKQKDVL
jgi:hypothetical protein